jgi:hypothetical protein
MAIDLVGDSYGLVLPEFPEFHFELRYVGGRALFRYGIFTSARYRGFSRKYRKRVDCVVRGYLVLMLFALGEIYSEEELDRLCGER